MAGFLQNASILVRPEIPAVFGREWVRLAEPGSYWTGGQRVAIAEVARAAREGSPARETSLPPRAIAAAQLLGATPGRANRTWAGSAVAAIGAGSFVELIGVVSRGSAVDSFHRAVGAMLPPFPDPVVGEPSGAHDAAARPGAAWVPMVGGASIVQALSAVPPEAAAQEDMHGPLYLTYGQMQDVGFMRGLTRAQMELVAARTSALNECFY